MSADGKCIRCGTLLPPGSDIKREFCDECRRARAIQYKREHRIIANAQSKERKAKKKAEARAKLENGKSLDKMAKEAHDLHITYGQYSALLASGGLQAYCKYHGLTVPR